MSSRTPRVSRVKRPKPPSPESMPEQVAGQTPESMEPSVTPDAAPDQPSSASSEQPPETPGPTPQTPDALFLARVSGSIQHMEGLHAQLTNQRDAIEAEHAARAARSPLALRLEIVGCQLAAEVWPPADDPHNIPEFRFGQLACPFGKQTPDQDCRACAHHKIMPLGQEMPVYTRRYHQYGSIIPLTEQHVTALAHFLEALDARALRRVDAELYATQLALENARAAHAQAAQRELERQQRGGR